MARNRPVMAYPDENQRAKLAELAERLGKSQSQVLIDLWVAEHDKLFPCTTQVNG